MLQQKIKRSIEFLLALIGLILASPILLIVAILVKTKLGSPILFRQKDSRRHFTVNDMSGSSRTLADHLVGVFNHASRNGHAQAFGGS